MSAKKFILVAIGSNGDVNPMVGLGVALVRRGHRVVLISNGYFQELIARAGLEFRQAGSREDYLAITQDPDLWHKTRSFRKVMEVGLTKVIRQSYQHIAELYEPGCTTGVGTSLAMGLRIAQEKLGIPMATVHLSPGVFRSVHEPPILPGVYMPAWTPRWYKRGLYRLIDMVVDSVAAGEVNRFRAELGLGRVSRIMDRWWHSPQLVLGMFPAWYAPPQPDWPANTRLVGFPLSDGNEGEELVVEVREWVEGGDRPIVFTPGSAMRHGGEFFESAAEACERLGKRGVFLTRFTEQLPGKMPGCVKHFPYVPLGRVLAMSGAVVHHGGIGTMSQGFAAGVPQLVMPLAYDQFDNVVRLERLGVGASIHRRKFKAPLVARVLGELMASVEVRDRCREVAERFHGVRPVEEACDLLEKLGDSHQGT